MKYAEEAIQVARAQNMPEVEGEQLVIQAMNYYELGDSQQAKEYIQDAIQLYSRINRPEMVSHAEAVLATFR
jgi:hypothetical protein